jgi:hypothetical protein
MDLEHLLASEAEGIVSDATAAVMRARMPHYDLAGEEGVRRRLETLYRLVEESVRTRNTTRLVAYAQRVAEERFEAGFDLAEVQTAINVLEEAIWRRAFGRLPAEALAEALGLVSTALGLAKDALARDYVSLASRAHAPSLDLRRLFEGTGEGT